MKKKQHQVKSRFYYIFWGAATVSVVLGQIYVGTGYRFMGEKVDRFTSLLEWSVRKEHGSI